jgi:carotenoid cleavage dioxygenase
MVAFSRRVLARQSSGHSRAARNPYLRSIYAPTASEITVDDLEVIGELPLEIDGAYYRNGPNPRFATNPHHWFDGDGMIHRVALSHGRASYANRYVRTRAWQLESTLGKIAPGLEELQSPRAWPRAAVNALFSFMPLKDTSNTDLIYFRDQIISLWWLSGRPYCLDPRTLEARGVAAFDGYQGNVSAHARTDPRTGELFFLDFSQLLPWVRVVSVDRHGKRQWQRTFVLPAPRIYHDILFTERHVVLMDFPVGVQLWPPAPVALHRRHPARIILVPRDGTSPEIIFETEACYVLHGLNAFEQDGKVMLSVCQYDDPFLPKSKAPNDSVPYVGALRVETRSVKWTLDLRTRRLHQEQLDDINTEFPRINDDYLGRPSRFSYHPRLNSARVVEFSGLIKYDWLTGKRQYLDLPTGQLGEEFVFIPRRDAKAEDDGWLVTMVHDVARGSSALHVYRADSLDGEPVAKVPMPCRVPAGFHAKWVANRTA